MAIKIRGFDQITAWIGGTLVACALLGMFWMISKCALQKEVTEKEQSTEKANKFLTAQESSTKIEPKGELSSDSESVAEPAIEKTNGADDRWGYIGTIAPWRWADLDPAWSLCSKGKSQSPVDISAAKTDPQQKGLRFHYRHGTTVFSLQNQTVQGKIEQGSWMDVDGERYDLNGVYFRTPGEHRVNGLPFEMEIQLIHTELSGKKLNVSVLVAIGNTHAAKNETTHAAAHDQIDRIVQALPRFAGETQSLSQWNWNDVLPAKLTYWSYRGSATIPPCQEDLAWYILTEPIRTSAKQIDPFVLLQKNNARPEQPLHGRVIARSNR